MERVNFVFTISDHTYLSKGRFFQVVLFHRRGTFHQHRDIIV